MNRKLFSPVELGRLNLKNRVVMAPMTRSRADADDCANDLMAEYYRQRASAGLIITEGTQPSANGKGYLRTSGIYNQAQVDSWKKVTEAVHAEGGQIVMQIMHCGRIGHPHNKAPGTDTIAPSAIKAEGEIFTEKGMLPFSMPRALVTEEIPGIIEEYRLATKNAFAAGFDGVELHCTSGYLPAQFLSTGTNQRDDQYGGSVENRVRFVLETLEAMTSVDGADRVGLRICPGNPFNDLHDDNPKETFEHLLERIRAMGLAYLHAITSPDINVVTLAKDFFKGPLIINQGFTQETAEEVLQSGRAEAVSFGAPFIANPDLVERFRYGLELATACRNNLYTGGATGYTDYPATSQEKAG
ncbi:MAG: alkene reductase [Endozoicomonas sp.]